MPPLAWPQISSTWLPNSRDICRVSRLCPVLVMCQLFDNFVALLTATNGRQYRTLQLVSSTHPSSTTRPMTDKTTDKTPTISTWWLVLLLAAALGAQGQRIFAARSAKGDTPFHSANDRSRWCGVAALGNYGRFEIDDIITRKGWNSIDKVRHRGRDGKQHYYSSKPPLLVAMHACVYGAVRLLTGLNILAYPFTAARCVLFLVNWLPLAIFWWMWGRYWQRQKIHWWTFTLIMLLMTWGTFVSTFANTLNNHLPGAIAAGVSLWSLLRIIEERHEGRSPLSLFILASFSAAMCAVCELPALAWAAATIALLIQIDVRKTILGVSVGMVPLAIAFAIVNYWAHGDLRPPYAHRSVGELVATIDLPAVDQASDVLARYEASRPLILAAIVATTPTVSLQAEIKTTRTPGVYEVWDAENQYRFALVQSGQQLSIHQWDDWYDYPDSYWYPDRKKGVDLGEPSRIAYLFHTTFGHHGLFSLTPMWLFVPVGVIAIWGAASGSWWQRTWDMRVQVMLAIVATSFVCFAFYMMRPLEDRNYGGVNCGFRWMHWFTPLWCWLVGWGLTRLSPRVNVWNVVAVMALAVSIYSACVPWNNPWTSPWLMTLLH